MVYEITQLRFMCKHHNVPLKNAGNGCVFEPTDAPPGYRGDIDYHRNYANAQYKDNDNWINIDTSELYCPALADELAPLVSHEEDLQIERCQDSWVIEAS